LERWLPQPVRRRLDPVEFRIGQAVAGFRDLLPGNGRVLDAGCGQNRFRDQFKHCFFVGYDRGIGDQRWDYSTVDVAGDLHQLAFRDECMDGVLCLVVLEHVADPDRVVAELARVLKKGGVMLLVVPMLWEIHQQPHDYFRFTKFGIQHLVEKQNLTVRNVTPLGGFFTVMARRCVNSLAFFQKSWRWPIFVLLSPLFGFLAPLLLPWFDRLDQDREFTLGYEVLVGKD
jgi:SAM-dependent methyltransferase